MNHHQLDVWSVLQDLGLPSATCQTVCGSVFRERWHPPSDVAMPLVIHRITAADLPWIQACLQQAYPPAHVLYRQDTRGAAWHTETLQDFDVPSGIAPPSLLVVPPLPAECSILELANILARLRAPGGCPWDREQTLASLRNELLSEAYEVIAAIDLQDDENLQEELGDLMMDTLFLIHIAMSESKFRLADVMTAICRKMIRRHPHVFGGEPLADSDEVLTQWDLIKQAEKAGKSQPPQLFEGIPEALPALEAARELQSKSRKAGLDPARGLPVPAGDVETDPDEFVLGQQLWELVARASGRGLNPEGALRRHNTLYRQHVDADVPGI